MLFFRPTHLGAFNPSKLLEVNRGTLAPKPGADGGGQVATEHATCDNPFALDKQCSDDEMYILHTDKTGCSSVWVPRRPDEPCGGYTDIHGPSPDITLYDVNLQPGIGKFVEVGPFRFPAEAKQVAFTLYGRRKLPLEWQKTILEAWTSDKRKYLYEGMPGRSSSVDMMVKMPSEINDAISGNFDNFPDKINLNFAPIIGKTRDPFSKTLFIKNVESLVKDKPKTFWVPIAKTKHPLTGKDYGLFTAIDTTGRPVIQVVWAEIDKGPLTDLWDWIKHVISKLVDFVCSKLHDPKDAVAATTAAAAGGPYAVAAVGGASLLCQLWTPPPEDPNKKPPEEKPAIEEKPKTWPYYVAGALTLFGIGTFLLSKPKKKQPLLKAG